jgi:hypothetical protein
VIDGMLLDRQAAIAKTGYAHSSRVVQSWSCAILHVMAHPQSPVTMGTW